MRNCVYFAENEKIPEEGTPLALGYGFTAEGEWRRKPFPTGKAGILVDDRCLPNRQGVVAARHALAGWNGLIIFDFERSRNNLLEEFVSSLAGKKVILPPSYGDCPHDAVLIGPWPGNCGFSKWLQIKRKRFGQVVLDAAPICVQRFPGGGRVPWTKALPGSGYPCQSIGCMHRRLSDGSILFWDTRKTLSDRLEKADVPMILFQPDWNALPEENR